MQSPILGSTAILHKQAVISPVCCFPDSAANTNIGCYTSNDQILYAFDFQEKLEIRVCESPAPGLVDGRFSWYWIEFFYRVVPLFSANQKAPKRPGVSDANSRGIVM